MKKSYCLNYQLAIRRRYWIVLPILLLLFAGCRDDSFFNRDPDKSLTIEDRLRANEDYSSFVAALDNTGLMNYIGETGLWTIYAPTNAALQGVDLNPSDTEARVDLIKRLNYHVGLGLKYTSSIKGDDRISTRNGKFLALDADPFTVDGVEFGSLNPNQEANNGVIHELNTFLVPVPNAPRALENVAGVSKFYNALEKFRGLTYDPRVSVDRNGDGIIDDSVFVETYATNVDLAGEAGRRTVFAPTNAAVDVYLETKGLSSLDDLSRDELVVLLNKHILNDYRPSATLSAGEEIETSGGTGEFIFDPGIVEQADIPSSNAVIHVINTVLNH